MLRNLKILLILSVAMWGVVGAFGNLNDWGGTTGAVAATTSMSTFEPGSAHWRATSNPVVITIGAVLIPALKTLTALLCFMGAWQMWKVRAGDAQAFHQAKTLALSGCAVAIFLLFTGWIVIAESWFELWRSEALGAGALGAAFRYGGMIGVIALFVGTNND